MKKLIIILFAFVGSIIPAWCCTSVIISGNVTPDGRSLMLKNRDTGELNNRVQRFEGPVYNFIGLVNSPVMDGEVWAGTNSAGFCIMNTASYNIKDDDVPDSQMDREGIVMYQALGICATLEEFEKMLNDLPRPMGVEANFGVIDAHGGAAYYEVNNHSWVKFDVNSEPLGYRVVTNFSTSGRPEDYEGYERYLTASDIMSELRSESSTWKHITAPGLIDSFSRSYRHSLLGVDYDRDWKKLTRKTGFTGVAVDQDFIPRRSTSASVAFQGVASGENPQYTVMWTLLGYPACGVAIPLLVGESDILPSYVKCDGESGNCEICDIAMSLKKDYVFVYSVSNGSHYFRIDNVLRGTSGRLSLVSCTRKAESFIQGSFNEIYLKWISGSISTSEFYTGYYSQTPSYLSKYKSEIGLYL